MQESERWAHIWELFDRLAELPREQRSATLATQDIDGATRAEVEALLRTAEQDEADAASRFGSSPQALLPDGTQVGQWRVQGLLGRGGMGEVYLAHRTDSDFEQQAALKLLMRMDSAEDRIRFAAERRILARLEHPGIAHFLDGGEHDGMPYAVMEYVEGVPVTAHARNLPLRKRVTLMLQACAAVSHAHHHLVIHRDLKPGNMLVTADGHLKLLDFGIAKRLSPGPDDASGATQVIRASPDYCAPEQLSGEPVSTATDVYALGVILFELLTGQRPWKLGGLPIIRAMERLALQELPLPSSRLEGARRRALRGDLDSIVLKALQARPDQRYPTVDELADDLCAYLDGRPVKARKATWGYLMARTVRRHRTATAVAGTVFLGLALGLVGMTWQARETAIERDIARREVARNDAVRQYLSLMFRTAGELQGGGDVTARGVLDRAAEQVHKEFANDPQSYADITLSLAELYFQLNDYTGARPLLTRLLQEKRIAGGVRAMAMHDLAQVEFRGDHDTGAADLLQQAQAFWQRNPERYRPQLLASRLLQSQIEFATGNPQQALQTLQDALPQRIALSGAEHRETAVLVNNLGIAHYRTGGFDEAAIHFKQAHALWQALGQDRSTDALNTLNNWAGAEVRLGRPEQAVDLFHQALELRRELYGPSAALAALLNNLGKTLAQLGRHDEALPLLREAMEMGREHAGGNGSTITLSAGMGLVNALAESEQPGEAREVLEWLDSRIAETHGTEHLMAVVLEISRAHVLYAEGAAADALDAIATTRKRLEELGPPGQIYLGQLDRIEQRWAM